MQGQGPVRGERQGNVAVLVIDAPPVNALGAALRQALWQAVTEAEADQTCAAIVIRAEGRTFPAGADISEFGQPPKAPVLPDLCDRIEACAKPVVAALHGTALGGGLELALAAHGRVALAQARLGLPEVTLGLCPGAGGTQRLPRLIGAEQALRLMLEGKPISAAEALALGLLDRVVEEGLEGAALELAHALAGKPPVPTRNRSDGLRDGLIYQRAVAQARARIADQRLPAPARIVDCVEAAQLLPMDQGLAFERAAFLDLVETPEAAGLRHAFFAGRAAARLPGGDAAAPPVEHLGVMGAVAADLVLPALQAGLTVALVDPSRPALVQALEKIAALQEQAVVAGRLTVAQRDADWARLTPAIGAAIFAECQAVLVAEAAHLAEVVEATPAGTLLAQIGRGAADPGARAADWVGFRPSGARLVELVAAPDTAPAQFRAAQTLARRLGFQTLRSAAPGGIAARVGQAGRAAVGWMLAQGELPGELAGSLGAFGLPGLMPAGQVQDAGTVSPRTAARILQRVLAAMANEGARLLGTGLAMRPSDIDFAMVAGQGFPRHEGGPMHWADRRGVLILRRDLTDWAEEAPEIWAPAPLLQELAAKGARFADLNR
ncbi:enoyl-CoA hydratase-related protein [Gemmobacter denitrificans]|uniref:Enoyl-CoA hydratase-related protein n=1 Tax=Gemmobacter denitrificans TaxID=3123040 RepID=A0ABU8BX03_9RHOB